MRTPKDRSFQFGSGFVCARIGGVHELAVNKPGMSEHLSIHLFPIGDLAEAFQQGDGPVAVWHQAKLFEDSGRCVAYEYWCFFAAIEVGQGICSRTTGQ